MRKILFLTTLVCCLAGCSPEKPHGHSSPPAHHLEETLHSKRIGMGLVTGIGLSATSEMWSREIEYAKNLKVGIIRCNADGWDILEPERDHYNWKSLDAAVNMAVDQAGLDFLFTLPISNRWNGQEQSHEVYGHNVSRTHFPTKDLASLRDFCRALADRYHGKIKYYEVWSEPDTPAHWKGDANPDASEYFPILKTAYTSIKEGDRNAQVLLGGLATPQKTEWLKTLLNLGGSYFFDIFNIHHFPSSGTLDEAIAATTPILDKFASPKPLWITETSTTSMYFETRHRDYEEYRKSIHLVQTYTQAIGLHQAQCIFWCGLKNFKKIATTNRDTDFGLMTPENTPLPAYTAHQVWSNLLMDSIPEGKLDTGGRIHVYQFRKLKTPILVLWSDEDRVVFTLPSPYKRGRVTTLLGETHNVDDSIELGKEPLYLELFSN